MNSKSAVRWALLTVVVGSLAVYAFRTPSEEPDAAAAAALSRDAAAADVVVTYFTTDVRCVSCRKIEALSRRAIEEGFAAEVASGRVVFRMLNTDRPEYEHFLDDYEIGNKTVIVSHQRDGKEVDWTNQQDVWLLFDDPEAFFTYVREPVRRYLDQS